MREKKLIFIVFVFVVCILFSMPLLTTTDNPEGSTYDISNNEAPEMNESFDISHTNAVTYTIYQTIAGACTNFPNMQDLSTSTYATLTESPIPFNCHYEQQFQFTGVNSGNNYKRLFINWRSMNEEMNIEVFTGSTWVLIALQSISTGTYSYDVSPYIGSSSSFLIRLRAANPLFCGTWTIYDMYLQSNEAALASINTAIPSTIYADTSFIFRTNHYDIDGQSDVAGSNCYGAIGDGTDMIRFYTTGGTGARLVTVYQGSASVSCTGVSITNGYQMTWTVTIPSSWSHHAATIDTWAFTYDDHGAGSGWQTHNTNSLFDHYPQASILAAVPTIMYADTQFSFTTTHTDLDGQSDVAGSNCYGAIGDGTDMIRFYATGGTGSRPVTVYQGSASVSCTGASIANGYQMTWTVTIPSSWSHHAATIDTWALTYDDHGVNSGWQTHNTNSLFDHYPQASIVTAVPSYVYAGVPFSLITNHVDIDGASDLQFCYVGIGDANDDIRFYVTPGVGSLTINWQYGSEWVMSASCTGSSITNGFQLTTTLTLDWDWDHELDVDTHAQSIDDYSGSSSWAFDNTNGHYENDLEVTSFQVSINSENDANHNGIIDFAEWFKGGVQVTASGTVMYEGSLQSFDSGYASGVEIQLFYDIDHDGILDDLGDSYRDTTIFSGSFSSIFYTPSAGFYDAQVNAHFDVAIQGRPSGCSDVTSPSIEITSKRDNSPPTTTWAFILDSSSGGLYAPIYHYDDDTTIDFAASGSVDSAGVGLHMLAYCYKLDSGSWSSWVSSSIYELTATEGNHTAYCRIRDEVNNFVDYIDWGIVDTTVPDLDSPDDFTYEQGTSGHGISWAIGDSNPYQYQIDGNGSTIGLTHWSNGTIDFNVDGFTPNVYNFTITVIDSAGNVGKDTVFITVEDTSAPDLDSPDDFSYEQGTIGHSISWTLGDINPYQYRVDGNGTTLDFTPWTNGTVIIDVDGLAPGVYNYTITVTDLYGNTAKDTVYVTVTSTTTTTTTPTTTSTVSPTTGEESPFPMLVLLSISGAIVAAIGLLILFVRRKS